MCLCPSRDIPSSSQKQHYKSATNCTQMMRRVFREALVVPAAAGVRHQEISRGGVPDTQHFLDKWHMVSNSQTNNKMLHRYDDRKHTISSYDKKPQERLSASQKYQAFDKTHHTKFEEKKKKEEAAWKKSMKGGGAPAPNPENVVEGYGMRRRVKLIDESELADPRALQDALELSQLTFKL